MGLQNSVPCWVVGRMTDKLPFVRDAIRMSDLLDASFAGEWGKAEGSALTPVFRTANFNEDGTLDYANPVMRCITEKKVHEKKLRRGDIILEKSGGTPNRPVGILAYFDSDDLALCSNFNQVLRFDARIIVPRYAFYQLRWLKDRNAFDRYIHKTTGLQNLEMKRFGELELLVPELSTQLHITDTLDKVLGAQHQLDAQLAKLDSLVKSRFVEMFGDGDFPRFRLDKVADVQGGLTKNRRRETLPMRLPYLRVANVGPTGGVDTNEMLSIGLTDVEARKTLLKTGDLLFVEGNGSKNQIGRVAIWDGSIDPCVHQNHLIRARLYKDVLPIFALTYFSSPDGRRQITNKAASTSGLFTLSTGKIKSLVLPVPPLSLQHEFSDFAAQVDKLRVVAEKEKQTLQTLYDSLAQEYFAI